MTGCVSFSNSHEKGLIEIELENLVETDECTGKGVEAYSARRLNRSFSIKTNKIYLSPGKWTIVYFPSYEAIEQGSCQVLEEIIIHGEFTISEKFKKGYKYKLKLNDEKVAYFEIEKM